MAFGSTPAELRQLAQAIKGIWAGGSDPVSADLAKSFGLSSGAQPYDLSQALAYLYPTFSPVRNRMTRLHVQG